MPKHGFAAIGLASVLVSGACSAAPGWRDARVSPTPNAEAVRSFLRFEENRGQVAPEADFVVRGSGYTVFLAAANAVFALPGAVEPGTRARNVGYLTMDFLGRGRTGAPQRVAEAPLPSRSHYLIGRDPSAWHTNVRHFDRVRYVDVYPGIDVVYRAGAALEYDIVVRPGADPATIRMSFSGASSLAVDRDGRLVAALPAGRVVLQPPHVFQDAGSTRRSVAGRFAIAGSNEIRFELGAYDPTKVLTIDPLVIVYSSFVGGSGSETATDIAVDPQGNAYVTGQTFSADFPVKGAVQATQSSGEDAYVLKVNPAASGSASLVYATYLGSTARDGAEGIAVDALGRAHVTGWTHAGDFPVTTGSFKPTWTPNSSPNDDESDAFAVILNAAGDQLVYGTFFGGTADDEGMGIHPSSENTFVLAGGTDFGSSFPTTTSAFDTSGQVRSAFVSVLRWSDNTLLYSTVYHADPNIQLQVRGLAVDATGRAHITGLARGAGLPVRNAFMATFPTDATNSFGQLGSFLAVFDPAASGNASLVYATYLGAGDAEDVATDSKGLSIVVGTTSVRTFPTTTGAFDRVCEDTNPADGLENGPCFSDAFVMKFDPAASGAASLVAATRLGGPRGESGMGVTVGSNDDIFVTGQSSSAGFPAVEGIPGPTAHPDGENDAFATRLTSSLNALIYSTKFGGVTTSNGSTGASDRGRAIAFAPDGGACIAGETSATDFPITRGFDTTLGGTNDAFVAKIAMPAPPCREVVITTVPGLPFIWEPPAELCVTWGGPGVPIPFPQPCPQPPCLVCGPRMSSTAGTGLPPGLSRLYRESGGVLFGSDVAAGRGRSTADPAYRAMLRAAQAIPNGPFLTKEVSTRLATALERPDVTIAGRRALRRTMTAALNAAELDWRSGGTVSARAMANSRESTALGEWGTVRLAAGEGEVNLAIVSGLPARPSGVHTAWPLASYRLSAAPQMPRNTQVEVELYVGWMSFGGAGEIKALAWNGTAYRNITIAYDASRGRIRLRVGFGEDIVIVRTKLCY